FNPLHSFKAWIYQITRNHCIDYLKSKKENMFHAGDIEIERILDHRTPEKITLEKDLVEKIENFLNVLEDIDREISFLRFYESLKYKEISRILNMNVNTVKSRARLIKKKIKNELNS
ncbi:MAG: sigma-70 family RNA polymerase sigma factor, partial [Candidatus Aminicenantes bacterium]|nr:sigma-70 family RNA polymerase sigma factor [Candidatus Aminicenantes bacterium]